MQAPVLLACLHRVKRFMRSNLVSDKCVQLPEQSTLDIEELSHTWRHTSHTINRSSGLTKPPFFVFDPGSWY